MNAERKPSKQEFADWWNCIPAFLNFKAWNIRFCESINMHDCHVQMLASASVFVYNFHMLYAVLDLVKVKDSQILIFPLHLAKKQG